MHLRALRVKGFKSFPRATELLFEPGVAVVIGPNGSGKSNLADAVMWALGEQSPSQMRGASMQDVIFAGSDGRRASVAAEVELILDNADGALPLPTPEVSVRRRVTRDGTSQYAINQSTCRLSDVVELMAAVGLGKELHSIISQGKVEGFLAGRPEDRRDQIEEAAGLGRYKRRRERAVLKLREVGRNLERADMLEREVGQQLAPLRRQANAAEAMRAVEHDIAQTRGRLLAGERQAIDGEFDACRATAAAVDDERGRLEEALARTSEERRGKEEALARRLAERERRAQRLVRLRALESRLEGVERLAHQRLRLLDELERVAHAERDRLAVQLDVVATDADEDGWAAEEARLEQAAADADRARTAAREALAAARAAVSQQRGELQRLAIAREGALAAQARATRRREALATESERLRRQAAALEDEGEGDGNEAQRAEGAAEAARAGLEAAAAGAATAAEALRAAREEREAVAQRQRGAVGERKALEAELEHLSASLRDLQEVGGDVLDVAGEYDGIGALATLLSCERGYEKALAAALSQASGAVAVPSNVDHWSLLSDLKQAGVNLVRLVIPAVGRRRPVAFPGAAPLLDKVSLREHEELEASLADAVIVDDLRAVPDGFPGLAVTRDGEFYRPSAGQLGLAGGLPTALVLERRAATEQLEERLAAVRARELREEAALQKAAEALEGCTAAHDEAAEGERSARVALEAAERALAAARGRVAEARETAARLSRAIESAASEMAEAETDEREQGAEAARALQASEELRPALEEAERALGVAEATHEGALAASSRAHAELEQRREASQRAADERRRAREAADAARCRLDELRTRLDLVPPLREVCQSLASRLAAVRARAQSLAARLEEQTPGDDALHGEGMRRLAGREAELRRDLQEVAERRTQAEVALARAGDRRAEVAGRLEEVAATLGQAAFTPPADDAEAQALGELLTRLERRRERIGPVNPLAEAECGELSERAAFLREQRRDLDKAVEELEGLIGELTERIDQEFARTFEAVQAQFEHMVTVLFPGGSGRLVLAKDEDGVAGVDVQVKPAKKLGKKLQLLSGGERALVAIAFLMALVLARPCAFYILDEIEAALDDVNIGRFVSLVRDYRERTQFIIITHQKRTMEAADVLYGVTMGADGASQVVSARMAEEEIEREERAKAGRPAGGRG